MVDNPTLAQAWPAENWKLHAREQDKIQTTAVSHLVKAMDFAGKALTNQIPTLGPATGYKKLLGTSSDGQGRLELHDGTRVLFLKGTPEQMGKQQGDLLKPELHDLTAR